MIRDGALALAIAAFVLLALTSCGGTIVEMEGQVCGSPVKFKVADRKDRSAFEVQIACGPNGSVSVSTADSSTSAVIQAQAEALTRLAGTLAREAAAGALP